MREHVEHGVDWIKLFPTGAYSFSPTGEAKYVLTYPMPVLQALIDEAHRLGHKTGCHVYGGEGQKNAILAGCDTIEHAFGLDQEQANMMVAKGLTYDPTGVRYTEPYMDDNDNKNTGRKYRMIPIIEKAVTMAAATKGLPMMIGSGVDGATFPHGTQALEFEWFVKHAGGARRGRSSPAPWSTPKCWAGRTRSARSTRASTPISSRFPAIRLPTSPSFSASSSS